MLVSVFADISIFDRLNITDAFAQILREVPLKNLFLLNSQLLKEALNLVLDCVHSVEVIAGLFIFAVDEAVFDYFELFLDCNFTWGLLLVRLLIVYLALV